MELTHEFTVRAGVDEAWAVLTDLARVAPCMPGLALEEVAGDEYRGVVQVKVGPMTARYRGVASFRERDVASRRAVIRAEARETRGGGNATATVTATLAPADGGTRVSVHTDLAITGKVAQFGRGVLAEVSRRLIDQFVQALEADVLSGAAGAALAVDAPARKAARAADVPAREAAPVDLLASAGPAIAKRLVPLVVVAALALLWLLLRG